MVFYRFIKPVIINGWAFWTAMNQINYQLIICKFWKASQATQVPSQATCGLFETSGIDWWSQKYKILVKNMCVRKKQIMYVQKVCCLTWECCSQE